MTGSDISLPVMENIPTVMITSWVRARMAATE